MCSTQDLPGKRAGITAARRGTGLRQSFQPNEPILTSPVYGSGTTKQSQSRQGGFAKTKPAAIPQDQTNPFRSGRTKPPGSQLASAERGFASRFNQTNPFSGQLCIAAGRQNKANRVKEDSPNEASSDPAGPNEPISPCSRRVEAGTNPRSSPGDMQRSAPGPADGFHHR